MWHQVVFNLIVHPIKFRRYVAAVHSWVSKSPDLDSMWDSIDPIGQRYLTDLHESRAPHWRDYR